jgi:hypothetical protein
VHYETTHFCERNKDSLFDDIVQLMQSSQKYVLIELEITGTTEYFNIFIFGVTVVLYFIELELQ